MRKGSRFLFIVGFMWLGMALVGVGLFGSALLKQHRTGQWLPTDAVITDSEVTSRPGNKGHPVYSAHIAYTFHVGGKEYSSSLTSMAPALSSTDRARAEAAAAANPAGKHVTAYYDPDDPNQAVLDRGLRARDWSVLIFLTPFVMVGLLLLSLAVGAHVCRGPGHVGTRRVIETGSGVTRIRTNTILAGSWGFIAALIVAVVGMVVSVAVLNERLTVPMLIGYYATIVTIGLGTWTLVRGARQRGYSDIVIDEQAQQITLPAGRAGPAQDIPFEQVLDTRLIQDSSMSQNRTRGWRVHLVTAGSEKTRPIVDILYRREAGVFNDWLRERLLLKPVEPPSA